MPKRESGKWYAQALFELAFQKDRLERCQEGLGRLAELTRDEALMEWFENPSFSVEAKGHAVQEGLGEVDPLVLNLAFVLISKDSLRLAGDLFYHYLLLSDARRGIERAKLTTAVPLDDRERETFSQRAEEVLGKRVTLDLQVDPSILGGFIARIGDTLIDGSVRNRLDSLGKSILRKA